jgi:hypothetical protein
VEGNRRSVRTTGRARAMSSEVDRYLRARSRRRPLQDPREREEPKRRKGLVSQGARSPRPPLVRERTVDDYPRSFRGRGSGVWERIF